ncbi:hypothetical protein HHL16_18955 [Pseudoflavitalea sp. G-6-1-2]|uniref:hypothetical protein n=1 Tax=Pseudoflavitalea sp. G-6-1-2 TaxID=2728841 RepID=UPI00146B85B8|nr:hypothetical protein [Pseudoflavitalea sp. G-6-1-2]NML22964.1 hypothetical protein [Pseudoflavitalea sp. G-6-1-2]
MNFLKLADGVSGLFPRKIKIDLIRSSTGQKEDSLVIREDLIPETFNKPTLLEIKKHIWRVVDAKVTRDGSYFFSKRLQLYVEDPDQFQIGDRFMVPSRPAIFPFMQETNVTDEQTMLHIDEWREFEFLPVKMASAIHEEILSIEAILNAETNANTLLGYDRFLNRNALFDNALQISVDDFIEVTEGFMKGKVCVKSRGVVENSFVIESSSATYYGLCTEGMITELSMLYFDSVDDELITLLTTFNLVAIDWSGAKIYMEPTNDREETAIKI